jgi:hypothetical protein
MSRVRLGVVSWWWFQQVYLVRYAVRWFCLVFDIAVVFLIGVWCCGFGMGYCVIGDGEVVVLV